MPQPLKVKPPRRVWRISKQAPLGEWVVPKTLGATPSTEALPEVSYGTWVTSSFDLAAGADVIEDPDAIPGELLDAWFTPTATHRKHSKS